MKFRHQINPEAPNNSVPVMIYPIDKDDLIINVGFMTGIKSQPTYYLQRHSGRKLAIIKKPNPANTLKALKDLRDFNFPGKTLDGIFAEPNVKFAVCQCLGLELDFNMNIKDLEE